MSRGLLAVLVACAFWAHALAQEPPDLPRAGSPGASQLRLIRQVAPEYPNIARGARVQGIVVLEATIDVGGRVSTAVITRSIPLLDVAAFNAVRQWEFAPPLIDNQPRSVVTTIAVHFILPFARAPASPAATAVSPSGMPPDFAVVYIEPCRNGLRHVLTSSTHDLDGIYREVSTAGLLSRGAGLRTWQDSSFLIRTTVFADRIEVVVSADPAFACGDGANYEIDVRAGGTWTQLWPPAQRDLQTPENERRLSIVRQLIQKAIAGK